MGNGGCRGMGDGGCPGMGNGGCPGMGDGGWEGNGRGGGELVLVTKSSMSGVIGMGGLLRHYSRRVA